MQRSGWMRCWIRASSYLKRGYIYGGVGVEMGNFNGGNFKMVRVKTCLNEVFEKSSQFRG